MRKHLLSPLRGIHTLVLSFHNFFPGSGKKKGVKRQKKSTLVLIGQKLMKIQHITAIIENASNL